MLEETLVNNVELCGILESKFEFNHEVLGEKFYLCYVKIKRLSETYDAVKCLVSEKLIDVSKDMSGMNAKIQGSYRSYNKQENGKTSLELYVFVKEISVNETQEIEFANNITLSGYLVKEPVFRRTTMSNRDIADIIIAVNRQYKKTDYIPCILWGRDARFISQFDIGSKVELTGRIQSRKYLKKLSETEIIEKTAYEVSVNKIIL